MSEGFRAILGFSMRFAAGVASLASLCLIAGASSPSFAADASGWDRDLRSAARLIAAEGATYEGVRTLRAGIEITLDPGWKTYWRYPGDSGVPPAFDFSGSTNVKSVELAWPMPMRFPDGAGGTSIGYRQRVLLPLRVTPADPAKPVVLRLAAEYGVCETVCVPARAKAQLTLDGRRTGHEATLDKAQAFVPKAAPIGGHAPASVHAVRVENPDGAAGKPRVLVDVAAPPDRRVDLIAEGPTVAWALPLPSPIAGAPVGMQRFAFELDGLPSGATAKGARLTLTSIAGAVARETVFRLD